MQLSMRILQLSFVLLMDDSCNVMDFLAQDLKLLQCKKRLTTTPLPPPPPPHLKPAPSSIDCEDRGVLGRHAASQLSRHSTWCPSMLAPGAADLLESQPQPGSHWKLSKVLKISEHGQRNGRHLAGTNEKMCSSMSAGSRALMFAGTCSC